MGIIDDFLKGLPVNSVLREKIDILREQINEMDASKNHLAGINAELEKKNADLITKNRNLKQQLSKQKDSSSEFAEIRGLKIKKLPAGGYDESVAYCFHCNSPLSAPHRMKILECTRCGYKSSTQARHLSLVISELKGEDLPDWWKLKY